MVITSHSALALNIKEKEQLHILERHFLAQRKAIENWFAAQWKQTPPPVYGSVDLRNAGFKLAPIDMNLLINDVSDGIPTIVQNLEQVILPPAELGWSQRLKSGHFEHYALVAAEFAELIKIDPWLISPLFRYCGEVDFMQQEGIECLT